MKDKWGLKEEDYKPSGYFKIPEVVDLEPDTLTEIKLRCELCGMIAEFIGFETKELLCGQCRSINDEARFKS